jgi:hypothetical protein
VNTTPTREQEDDGRFVSKYLDTVANKQYQQLFCQYNQVMFAKVRGLIIDRIFYPLTFPISNKSSSYFNIVTSGNAGAGSG